jgi:CBS-domain-containing membrane protein
MTVHATTKLDATSVMTHDPITVDVSTSAHELARILTDNDISGVPVIDVQDRVIGVVSKTDLLKWCVTGGDSDHDLLTSLKRSQDHRRRTDNVGVVEDFMTSEPVVATADEPITSLARRMVEEKVHRIAIVDEDGCLTGIVTSLDLLRAFARQA